MKTLRLEEYMVCSGNDEWTRLCKIEIPKWQPTLQIQCEDMRTKYMHILYNAYLIIPTFKNWVISHKILDFGLFLKNQKITLGNPRLELPYGHLC